MLHKLLRFGKNTSVAAETHHISTLDPIKKKLLSIMDSRVCQLINESIIVIWNILDFTMLKGW